MKELRTTRGHGLLETFLSKKRTAMANRLIPAGHRTGRLLDIGCGTHPFFLTHTDFSEKHGLDKIVQSANEISNPGLRLQTYDVETGGALPYPDNHFSVVTMLAVFEHIDQPKLVPLLQDIKRVLQPGGLLVMTTPAGWADGLIHFLAKINLLSHEEIHEHKDKYSHKKIAEFLTAAGFAETKLRFGHFECWLNLWATATK